MRPSRFISSVCAVVCLGGVVLGGLALHGQAAAQHGAPSHAVTLDNVTLTIGGQFLPSATIGTSHPGDASQVAMSASHAPYQELTITAIPYGTRTGTEALPVAHAGSAAAYRALLRALRLPHALQHQSAPAVTLFGASVVGDAYRLVAPWDSLTPKPAILMEWVTEAGPRVWILRVVQEQIAKLAANIASTSFFGRIASLSLSSVTLNRPTTVQAKRLTAAVAATTPDGGNLPSPSWWDGSCDTNYYAPRSGYAAHPLGASFRGVQACGPRPAFSPYPPDVNRQFFPGAHGEYEWECVELSMRFMYLAYGIDPYPANGNGVVANYSGSRLVKVNNGTPNEPLAPGLHHQQLARGRDVGHHLWLAARSLCRQSHHPNVVICARNCGLQQPVVYRLDRAECQSECDVNRQWHGVQQSGNAA